MPTSKFPTRVTLFTKEDCLPCAQTKKYLYDNFYTEVDDFRLLDVLTVMKKEDHPALIAAFKIELFPTLLIHQEGRELDRVIGGRDIRGNLRYILTEVAQKNFTEGAS